MTGGGGGLERRGDSGGELGTTIGPVGSDGTYVGMTWGEWLRITSEFCRRVNKTTWESRERRHVLECSRSTLTLNIGFYNYRDFFFFQITS